jgi:hypothetical protein
MRRLALLALAIAAPALAAPLTVTKTATVVSDPVNTANPKAIPGAVVDYTLVFSNPTSNLTTPVQAVVMSDTLPVNVALRVSDLTGTGSGPVIFTDGGVLGLLGSGLTCTFSSLSSTTDCIDFSTNGTDWSYVPTPDANGYDSKVRAIRVSPTGSFATSVLTTGAFQLRYRVKIK